MSQTLDNSVDSLVSDMEQSAPKANEEIVGNISGDNPDEPPIPFPPGTEIPLPADNPNRVDVGPVYDTFSGSERSNERFDPAIHERDKSGNPVLTKDGKFRRKRGSKPGTQRSAPQPNPNPNPQQVGSAQVNFGQIGEMLAGLLFGTSMTVFGPHWEPNKAEAEQIQSALARYCAVHGWIDLPPGAALALVVGMYAAPRIAHPETKIRLRAIGEGLGIIRPRPTPRPANPNAGFVPHPNPVAEPQAGPMRSNPLDQFNKTIPL